MEKKCKEVLHYYVKGKTFRQLYREYSPHIVFQCLHIKKLTLQYLLKIDKLNDKKFEILKVLVRRNRFLRLNKDLIEKTLKIMRNLGLENSIEFAGYMIASKKFSRNIKYNPEIGYILDKVTEKRYGDVIRLSVTKPVIKTLLALVIYVIVVSGNPKYLDIFLRGVSKRRIRNYIVLFQNLDKVSYIPFKEKFVQILIKEVSSDGKIRLSKSN